MYKCGPFNADAQIAWYTNLGHNLGTFFHYFYLQTPLIFSNNSKLNFPMGKKENRRKIHL